MTDETEMPAEAKEALKEIAEVTKKGFSLQDRLKNRGLRRGSIRLFLDEETGDELGWTRDLIDQFGNATGHRDRSGVLGDLEVANESRATFVLEHEKKTASEKVMGGLTAAEKKKIKTTFESALEMMDGRVVELNTKREELTAKLNKTSIFLQIRAVPPKIQRDCRRKARATLEIKDKNVPEDMAEEFNASQSAHLMTVMVQSITDADSGAVNEGASYQDAMDLIDELPPGQFTRLDELIGRIQFTDSISESIEVQEDFS